MLLKKVLAKISNQFGGMCKKQLTLYTPHSINISTLNKPCPGLTCFQNLAPPFSQLNYNDEMLVTKLSVIAKFNLNLGGEIQAAKTWVKNLPAVMQWKISTSWGGKGQR